ncbi:MAG: tetratricopeptide repeat protein [Desulfarculales bacterium]|nr:tetratricopeptide repeat protein [Desulfarculales bacterium]
MTAKVKYWKETINSRVGTGDTAKKTTMENYWEAEYLSEDKIKMYFLDSGYERTGYSETVKPTDLGSRFTPLDEAEVRPKDLNVLKSDQVTSRAERHLANNELNSAEFEFNNALQLNAGNVRANLGLGKTYLAQGNEDKAKERFVTLSTIEEVLEPDNKYVFNELGIQMRKLGLFKEAGEHYAKALTISANDEHLWFNQSRCFFEAGDIKQAIDSLRRALAINSDFEEGRQFLLYIKQQLKGRE